MWALLIILYAILLIVCTVISLSEKRFVTYGVATTVGIPDMGSAEREFPSAILIEEQWEIAPIFIYNYVV